MELYKCKNCKAVYDQKKERCPNCECTNFIIVKHWSRGVEIKEREKEAFGKFVDCLLKTSDEK